MKCKVCGMQMPQRFQVAFRFPGAGCWHSIIEVLCWRCLYWTQTGKIMAIERGANA